jgi:kynurenine formamidase
MTRTIDLTRPLDRNLEIYSEGEYSDPPLQVETWCTIREQGYWVARVCLGTQTGTHIDAPAHFYEAGETLEQLPVEQLMGRFFRLPLDAQVEIASLHELLRGYEGEPILFLACRSGHTELTAPALETLCALPARVWVLHGAINVRDQPPLHFHRRIAQKQKYLVEDLDVDAAGQVDRGGTLMALPLNLLGVSGAPCRVVAILD